MQLLMSTQLKSLTIHEIFIQTTKRPLQVRLNTKKIMLIQNTFFIVPLESVPINITLSVITWN